MTFSDKTIDYVSMGLSLLIHGLILLIYIPSFSDHLTSKDIHYKIPVTLTISEAPIPKKKETAAVSPTPKPTSLPGDRKQPLLKHSMTPVYPKTALNNEWSGTVTAEIGVDPEGHVISITIVKSSGYPILDESFKRSLQGYQYLPKREMGINKSGKTRVTYAFKLEEL